LKGQFSRFEYNPGNLDSAAINQLTLQLPAMASDPYFRDDIGNVSTSHFRQERQRSVLELKPRFPLYGGWFYNWHHGYNLPLSTFLKRMTSGRYVFQADFVNGIPNAAVDSAEVKIVLPEGARDIQVHVPFEVDEVLLEKTYTYLDTSGRPTVLIRKANVVDEHSLPFQVNYTHDNYYCDLIAKRF
jgi:oligosaccharyltransferase complex subunit alpha (ribophorin I)